MVLKKNLTYRKFREAEVANLDAQVVIDQHIVTLDVPVGDAEVVHVFEHDGGVDCDLQLLTHR